MEEDMHETLEEEVNRIGASMDNTTHQDQQNPQEPPPDPEEIYHVYHVEGGVFILKEDAEPPDTSTVDTTLAQPKLPPLFVVYVVGILYLFLIFSCIAFQVYVMFHPPIATITIMPVSKTITTTTSINAVSGTAGAGEIQARLLPTLIRSESALIHATGRGHQNASVAQGTITFYNGLLTSQTVAAGTIFTDVNGVSIITNQTAIIPAATPPIEGIATVTTTSVLAGTSGNIPARAIVTPCCAPSVVAVNLTSFQGGLDARDYTYLTQSDIDKAIQSLKNHLTPQMQQTIQGQVKQGESLVTPTCSQTVNADHNAGDETLTAFIKLTEQCYSVTYQNAILEDQAVQIVTSIAQATLDSHYALIESIQMTIHHATMQDVRTGRAAIALTVSGTWVYQFSKHELDHMKLLIAGKSKEKALQIIYRVPGIQSVRSDLTGDMQMPTQPNDIHVQLLEG